MSTNLTNLKGGEFLVNSMNFADIYTPEDLTEDQILFKSAIEDFVKNRILPNIQKIDKQEPGLTPKLMEEAGELGVLGAGIPEEYGGLGLDFNTETVIAENLGKTNSFSVSVAAHSGIGTLPILYFGTEAQKTKYLPGLSNGQIKAAYCLTEPDSGSDALAAKTRADLSPDGTHYIINGQKMWITNGGFADMFIVFAKIDGKDFTGFIVDKNTEGLTLGAEEDKLGIKGSSTRQVFFNNVKIPKENVLGEIGKGHKIAFNVLNIGRYKLCALVMGGCKAVLEVATHYAIDRHQFGQSIANFGAIKHKLAEMAIRTFACESATYKTSGLITNKISELVAAGKSKPQAKLEAAEEYAIECAILKVHGSETLDYVVDENVQIHGGSGFSEEYPAARAFRDARINRIFEGTNEINRLLLVGMLLKKALKGTIDIMTPALAVQKELTSFAGFDTPNPDDTFHNEKKYIANAKKAILMVAGAAVQKYTTEIENEQEVMMDVADMLIGLYTAESSLERAQQILQSDAPAHIKSISTDCVKVYTYSSIEDIAKSGREAINYFASGDMMKIMQMGLKRFTTTEPFDSISARRRIADHLIETGGILMA
ncbi:MAG: acyl-CoA dehydrogenase family protein [Saprospiraceae bacterium]|nr:acyl-CoA dehydrogenase family protein [Saprospiraceae bacterium]MBL0292750.1 acyl-CoA dehydrogenase family protein [Saprospiraceae bacterium]